MPASLPPAAQPPSLLPPPRAFIFRLPYPSTGVYDDLFQRLAKAEADAHDARADRKSKRAPGPFPRFGAPPPPAPSCCWLQAARCAAVPGKTGMPAAAPCRCP